MSYKYLRKYVLIHKHRYGFAWVLFSAADFTPLKFTSDEQIKSLAKACGLDYEPEREEEILIYPADGEIIALTKADLKG